MGRHALLPQLLVRQLVEFSLPAAADALEGAATAGPPSDLAAPFDTMFGLARSAAATLMTSGSETAVRQCMRQQRPALLDLSARLIAALPLECEEEGSEGSWADAWRQVSLLLTWASMGDQPADQDAAAGQSSQAPDAEAQAGAWAVLVALPRLAAAAPLVGRVAGAANFQAWLKAILWVAHSACIDSTVGSLTQLRQALASADAVLCMAAAAMSGPAQSGGLTTPEVLTIQSNVLGQTAAHIHRVVSSAASELPAAELAAAAKAAVKLHADGCRLLHRWAAATAEAGAGALPSLDKLHSSVVSLAVSSQPLLSEMPPGRKDAAVKL